MGLSPLTSYGTTASAYQSFANGGGNGPLNYNVPASSIRGSAGRGSINTGANQTREDRIQGMVDQALERFDAQTGIRQAVQNRWQTDLNNTTQGPLRQINQSFLGPELNRQTYGGNTYTGDSYSKFMNSQSGDRLFGGSAATPEMRYKGWNDQIAQRGQQAQQVLQPLFNKYGGNVPLIHPQTPWWG